MDCLFGPIVTVLIILSFMIITWIGLTFWGPQYIQKLKKTGVRMGTGENDSISEASYSDTLTSATYRLLGHTTHTVTFTFYTYAQASVLYKIAIGTTKVSLEKKSAILNFVEKHGGFFSPKLLRIITRPSWSIGSKSCKILFRSEVISR